MTEPTNTPADIPLESSFETVVGLPGGSGVKTPGSTPGPGDTGPTKISAPTGPPPPSKAPSASAGAQTTILPKADMPPQERPPTIPDVSLERTLGQGGMGTVYKGRQLTLDRAVAVKAIHPALAKDRTFVERFEREAKVLAKLSHANIVGCYSAGTCAETGKHYLLMEYVEGEDLLKRVKKEGPLSERDALVVAKQVAEGLEHALEAGVIHRDVKPENILLKPVQGRAATSIGVQAKIVDLGLAALAQPDKEALRLTEAGTALGTPLTMAPEQAEAPDSIDHRVDIYALGCTLFYALTARFPHEGNTIAQVLSKKLRDETPNPKTLRPDIADSTAKLALQMMSFDPAKRPATYERLVEQLDAEIARFPSLSTGRLSSAKIASAHPPTVAGQLPAGRGPVLLGGLVALALLGGASFGIYSHLKADHQQPPPLPVPGPTPQVPTTTPPVPVSPPVANPPVPPVTNPPAPSVTPAKTDEPPTIAWSNATRMFGDTDATRFANLDRQPPSAWAPPDDEDEFPDVGCNAQAQKGPAVAWFKPAIDTAVRVEGAVLLRTLTEEAGVRLDFGTDTVDVIADCLEARDATKDPKDLRRTWKLLALLGTRGPSGKPLAFKNYPGTPNLGQRMTVVVARGSIWARLDDLPEKTWSVAPAPGKLVRVGLLATKGTASFKEFRVESARD